MDIYKQLTEYCDCLHDVSNADVDELIELISVYTCWAQNPCETFLFGCREEVIDLPDCVDDCDVFVFEPFYTPFDPDSVLQGLTLVAQKGIGEETTQITTANYSLTDQNFKIKLPIPSCKCGCKPCECECPTHYKLLVRYNAGFTELPDCLLPIFCEALQYIKERRNCDCDKCSECDKKYGEDQTEVLVDDAAKLTDELKAYLVRVLSKQYKRQLSLISLCETPNELWGFRV